MTTSTSRLISFTAIAVALNIIGANIALFLKLPIYLDTIGTLFIAVVFGPWLGSGAAIISALINWMTTDIFSLYFSPVAIVLAIITGYLINPEENGANLIWKSLLVSLSGTVISSIIAVILFQGITSSGSSLVAQFLTSIGLDKTTSLILVQAGTDYLDRLLSLIVVMLIIKTLKGSLPIISKRI